jgi:hypothetical protein
MSLAVGNYAIANTAEAAVESAQVVEIAKNDLDFFAGLALPEVYNTLSHLYIVQCGYGCAAKLH